MELQFDFSKTILCISDMHGPYHHPDSLDFLDALKKKYKPLGDLVDNHGISFHDSDPDLDGPGKELEKAQAFCQDLEVLFPRLTIIGSNHGDLPLRKFVANGLPRGMIRPYHEMYGVSTMWRFIDDLTLTDGKTTVYFVHGISKNGLKVVAQRGLCVVQGHFHTDFRIDYLSNPANLLWSMQAGCLIDKKSLAFAYNQLDLQRPIIGTGIIKDGLPILEPMILNKKGRWVGNLT
jgi:hypothetical protein